ncbi:MAG: Asp23/Gls24 family envelope stress response protein [Culicoidibacterales bacterium]
MNIKVGNNLGSIEVYEEVLKTLAGAAATECYGVVGMASQQFFRDGLAELLGQDNYQKGIAVRVENNVLHIDLFVIISYGIRVSEVVHEIQKKVKYDLEKTLNITLGSVNVFIQDVQR